MRRSGSNFLVSYIVFAAVALICGRFLRKFLGALPFMYSPHHVGLVSVDKRQGAQEGDL